MKQLKLDEQKILKKKFKANVQGYDSLEVDEFLDNIRNDYLTFALISKELEKLLTTNETLQKGILDLEAKNIVLTKRIKELESHVEKKGVTLELLKKVDKYERKLWQLGIDPKKIA